MNSYMQHGKAAMLSKNYAEAVMWLEKAVIESPNDPNIIASLGQSLCWQDKRNEGLNHLRKAGHLLLKKARKSRNVHYPLLLVQQLHFWDDFEGALELLKKAVLIDKNSFSGYQLMAISYARLNKKKRALNVGKQALQRAPDHAMMNILQSTLEASSGKQEAARKRLEKVLKITGLTPEEKFRAHKELAKILDKIGCYDEVFEHLHASSSVSHNIPEIQKQDMDLVPNMIKTNREGFDQDLLQRWSAEDFRDQGPAPVFLIGFLRSGTTLTQEVLGAHPDIFVVDETSYVPDMLNELNRICQRIGTTAEQLENIDLSTARKLRQHYWNKVDARYGDTIGHRILLDKATMNTIDLGLINCIFPDAKVIFVMRDPRDVCLSCFMQIFKPSPATAHLLSWQGTADLYTQVMAWWMYIKESMTMDFIEFRYEDVVTEFEITYRNIFEFLDISWEESVADFHKSSTGKYIASPSYSQVAQPLYASSVARWKHYETEFSPILDKLTPFITAFNYEF